MNNKCIIDRCDNFQHSKGYCNKHYLRYWRHGDPLHVERIRPANNHNMSKSPEHTSWKRMINRCYDKNHNRYKYYGAKGITVCDRWKNSFTTFYEDMGNKPFSKAQIDRKENDKGYFKNNCRWVTCTINNRNRGNNILNEYYSFKIRDLFKSKLFSINQLSSIYKVPYSSIWSIVHNMSWKEAAS